MIEERQKTKILLLAAIYVPPYSGAGYQAQLLKDSAFSAAFELRHINTAFVSSVADLESVSALKVVRFLKYLGLMLETLATDRPDFVIMCPAFGAVTFIKDSIYTLVCAKLFRRRVIWWCHACGASRLFDAAGPLLRRYIRWTAAATTRVVTVGSGQWTDLGRVCPEEKLSTIHGGVPVQFYPAHRFRDRQGVNVLYFANFEAAKGWMLLLQAARRICSDRDGVVFDFYGNPAKDSSPEAIAAAFASGEHTDRIRYRGPAYGEAKRQAFERADIFCFPTFFPVETFGLVNLEAMNAALPIVSTRHASIPDAVIDGAGGLLVPTNDVEALVRALVALIDDRGLRLSMGLYNQLRFAETFTVNHFVQRWIALMRSLERPVGPREKAA